jgi:hypothetical protein
MTYIARFARQNRAPSPTNPELTTRINYCPKLFTIMKSALKRLDADDDRVGGAVVKAA